MTSGDVGDIDIIVKKKHNTSMGASKTCIKICVGSSTPESAPVAYYESQDLPGLLEAKKRGEVMSIVPAQMLKVQFRHGSAEADAVQQMARATAFNSSRSGIKAKASST